jgi:ABC-type antimicrobial peptide transport system permease subunit
LAKEPRSGEPLACAVLIQSSTCSPVQTAPVPLHPSISASLIALAVLIAVGGALLAGAFGSWRVSRLPSL